VKVDVGYKVREIRNAHGLSQQIMADKLGTTVSALSKMESGIQKVDIAVLKKLNSEFGISVDEMLGLKSNKYFRNNEDDQGIRNNFRYVLGNYLDQKEKPFKNNAFGSFIRREIGSLIARASEMDLSRYKVYGSNGQGQWAEIPWIVIANTAITESAQKGIYIVYLFKADMSGFYLSLNQGWTYFKETSRNIEEAKYRIGKVAAELRAELRTIPLSMSCEKIELCGSGQLSNGYEYGHIIGKYYDAGNLPSSAEMIDDLCGLLTAYDEVAKILSGQNYEKLIEFLIREDKSLFSDSDQKNYDVAVDKLASSDSIDPIIEEDNTIGQSFETKGRKVWMRNARKAAYALVKANYQCGYNNNHTTFVSNATCNQYMEVHHLVPMSSQGDFEVSLDMLSNIVPLCPNCHCAIHFARDEKKLEMLQFLFYKRRDALEKDGIEITFSDLKKLYGIASK